MAAMTFEVMADIDPARRDEFERMLKAEAESLAEACGGRVFGTSSAFLPAPELI